MKLDPKILKKFAIRVRIARAWKGLAYGLFAGAVIAGGMLGLDYLRVIYAELPMLWIGACAAAALGLFLGFLMPVSPVALADSIDRRARLENRLTTAAEKGEAHSAFEEALQEDARSHLEGLRPAKLYPIRFGRLQAGALGMCLLISCLFLLGNTPLTEEGRKKAAELEKKKAEIERVLKPLEEAEERGDLTEAERKLASELRKLEKDLRRNRLSEEEALQKGNELVKEGKKLAQQRMEQVAKEAAAAEDKLGEILKQKLQEAGLENAQDLDPSMLQKSDAELSKEISETKSQIDDLMKQLQQPGLSDQERESLEQALEQKKQQLYKLELSERAKKVFARLQKHPLMKEIQALAKEMAEKMKEAMEAQQAAQGKDGEPNSGEAQEGEGQQNSGSGGQISQADLDAYKEKLEALAARLEDDEEMQKFLEEILENLKNCETGMCMGGLPGVFGLPIPGAGQSSLGKGVGGPGTQYYYPDMGGVHMNDQEEQGAGKTKASGIRGQKREIPGEEVYIEVKGPASINKRSSVPYQKVLPSYKGRAEEAIGKSEIPKEHQERVKKYFESLGG